MEDEILGRTTQPVAFAFDEVDRILGRPYPDFRYSPPP